MRKRNKGIAKKELGKMMMDACKYFITIGAAGPFISGEGKGFSLTFFIAVMAAGIGYGILGYWLLRQVKNNG